MSRESPSPSGDSNGSDVGTEPIPGTAEWTLAWLATQNRSATRDAKLESLDHDYHGRTHHYYDGTPYRRGQHDNAGLAVHSVS